MQEENDILDYLGKCTDEIHCPNPTNLRRYIIEDNLTKEEEKKVHFFVDECDRCWGFFKKLLEETRLKK